jgi:hypothetical protein
LSLIADAFLRLPPFDDPDDDDEEEAEPGTPGNTVDGLTIVNRDKVNQPIYHDNQPVHTVVSNRRWFRPKVSDEYLAETECSVLPAETESQNSAFLNIQSKRIVKKSMQNH